MSTTATRETAFFTTADEKRRLLSRLARVEGQLRGIQKMIEREEDCERIVQQLAAARGALGKAFFELIACAFETKLGREGRADPEMQEKIAGLAAMLAKYA